MKKTIGILGGMGPMATCTLFKNIIELTNAKSDQDHIHILIDNNPAIPDRTKAILENGESPLNALIKSALTLQESGADFLVMPCNTAHYYYDDIIPHLHIPLIHMVERTVSRVQENKIKKVGLLATTATLDMGLYDPYFAKENIDVVKPCKKAQDQLMEHIFNGVKAGKPEADVRNLKSYLDEMVLEGVEVFVLACTEVPLLFQHNKSLALAYPILDTNYVLAQEAVKEALKYDFTREVSYESSTI